MIHLIHSICAHHVIVKSLTYCNWYWTISIYYWILYSSCAGASF